MKNMIRFAVLALSVVVYLRAADDVVSAVHGTVTKVDAASKTMVVKAKDGTEQTIHYVGKTSVKGWDATEAGAKDSWKGVKEGSEVVVHYSTKGVDKTATEVDRVGKDGLKSVDGTVTKVGKDGKTVVMKAADGTEQTFQVAGKDTEAAAKGIGKNTDKAAKVTVYYTQSAGKKIAHFFE